MNQESTSRLFKKHFIEYFNSVPDEQFLNTSDPQVTSLIKSLMKIRQNQNLSIREPLAYFKKQGWKVGVPHKGKKSSKNKPPSLEFSISITPNRDLPPPLEDHSGLSCQKLKKENH